MLLYKRISTPKILTLLLIVSALASSALAGDAIKASVRIPAGEPTPLVAVNGSGYTPGTYAIGTIRLVYTVVASAFQTGDFATFTLEMENIAGEKGGKATVYPVTLNLDQTGSSNLTLTPDTPSFSVTGSHWSDSTDVKILIPGGVPNDDGTTLTGNLQLETDPSGAHLGTVTTVQVQIRLVHPSGACLRTYNFVTDASLSALKDPITVKVNDNKGVITSTNPGQLSENVIVVNACSDAQTFDLKTELDAAFLTHPNGNPGNAVFTFVTLGATAPSSSTVASFTSESGVSHGQALCLPAITLQPNNTLLATVHMGINTDTPPSVLTSSGVFQFQSSVMEPSATCGNGDLNTLASPNPVTASLPYLK